VVTYSRDHYDTHTVKESAELLLKKYS